jgi:hypothetical protein
MFDIITSRDFHAKLKADYADFLKDTQSARLALNCINTAYHLHEWVWGDWLKSDHATWKELGIRDKESFIAWLDRECPGFQTLQGLANGAKHFIRNQKTETRRVSGYGMGPYGVGSYGQGYLLIDHGTSASEQRWRTARELIETVVNFWDGFFERHYPKDKGSG